MDFFEHGGRNGGTNISYDFSANINPPLSVRLSLRPG